MKIKVGEIQIRGFEDEEVYAREYFPARTLKEFKEHARRVVEKFFKDADAEDVRDFVEKEVFPAIEVAWAGEHYIAPQRGEYYVTFALHEIPSEVVEEAMQKKEGEKDD